MKTEKEVYLAKHLAQGVNKNPQEVFQHGSFAASKKEVEDLF